MGLKLDNAKRRCWRSAGSFLPSTSALGLRAVGLRRIPSLPIKIGGKKKIKRTSRRAKTEKKRSFGDVDESDRTADTGFSGTSSLIDECLHLNLTVVLDARSQASEHAASAITTDSGSSSRSIGSKSVRFADQVVRGEGDRGRSAPTANSSASSLVSGVYTRPYTAESQLGDLYYSFRDIQEFRAEALLDGLAVASVRVPRNENDCRRGCVLDSIKPVPPRAVRTSSKKSAPTVRGDFSFEDCALREPDEDDGAVGRDCRKDDDGKSEEEREYEDEDEEDDASSLPEDVQEMLDDDIGGVVCRSGIMYHM